MFKYITLDDRDSVPVMLHGPDTPGRKLNGAKGLAGGVRSRRNTSPRPYGHGGVDRSRYADVQQVALTGFVKGATDDTAWSEWEIVSTALNACLDAPRTLRYQWGTAGPELQASLKLVQIDGPAPSPTEPHLLRYQAQFEAEDYRGYTQNQATTVGNPLSAAVGGDVFPDVFPDRFTSSAGGELTVTIAGTAPTPPLYRISGGLTDGRILCDALGIEIVLDATLGATDHLDIDVLNRTVMLNGIVAHPEYINYPASSAQRWADLPPGTWPFRLLAPTFDTNARLSVITRDAYL